jgi:hypothetical protein
LDVNWTTGKVSKEWTHLYVRFLPDLAVVELSECKYNDSIKNVVTSDLTGIVMIPMKA